MKTRFLLAAVSLTPGIVFANWSGGIATLLPSSPYLDVGNDVQVIPIVSYEGERFAWRGPSLEYRLSGEVRQTPRWSASLNLSPNELDAGESAALVGIDDRDFSFLAGISYTHPTDFGEFSLQIQTDISGKHDGQRVTAGWQKPIFSHPQRKWIINAGIEAEYLSADYADYYFGVSATEANRTAFDQYQLDSIVQPAITLGGYYAFNQQWRLITNFRFQQLASDIENSPIIDSGNSMDGFIALIYDF